MSVWKKFQRVGKKAAKYQFTASYTELFIETNNFKPTQIVITWLRRNRKYPSEPIKLIEIPSKPNHYSFVWEVPRNEEILTTLYKMKKDMEYEEKDWTFQIEDVGNEGFGRRLLAYRNVNVAQYAEAIPTQNNIKITFKMSSKKVKSAVLFLTLSAVFLKEGEATDDDMISVASLSSLPSNQNFLSVSSNDIGVISDLDDEETSIASDSTNQINEKFSKLCDQIGSFQFATDNITENNSSPKPKIKENDNRNIHSAVKPLNIKVDYSDDRLFSIAEDETSEESNSTSDLLEWAQSITDKYNDVKVTNFTTSFRNGIAFCAIIHHFHPNLIDFESLKPSNVKENNRIAFSAAASLGIPKVLDPNEMNFLKIPDLLSVMTYLHQLRTHFTDNNLIVIPGSIGNNSAKNYSKQASSSAATSPTDIKNTNFSSPTEIDETKSPGKSPTPVKHSPEPINKSPATITEDPIKIPNEPIIIVNEEKTPTKTAKSRSPKKPKMTLASFNVDGTVKDKWLSERKIKSVSLGPLNMFSEQETKEISTSPTPKPAQTNGHQASPSLPKDNSPIQVQKVNDNYIAAETEALEREQDKIDEEASQLEKQLRLVMGKDKKKESILMRKWFNIVNKKNALIRRNMQLQILEKEQNLERKWNLLQEELRQIISIEDWSKTEEMKRREDLLMKDLINIVNQRDKVVKDLDAYEQGIATDMEFARDNQEKMIGNNIFSKHLANAKFGDKNCVIQ